MDRIEIINRPRGRVARYIVGIAGGRPGAGRSLVGANLAAAMAGAGWRVGLTDVETSAPLAPEMLGAGRPRNHHGRLVPGAGYGVQVMSFAWLVNEAERLKAHPPPLEVLAERLQASVAWNHLDLLLVEMPPSPEDSRSICDHIGFDGVVIVATPQGAEEGATEAAVTLYGSMGVPILGLIENLSYYACRHCGQQQEAEYSGAVSAVACRTSTRFMGEIPISISLRDCLDESRPAVACTPRLPEAGLFEDLAGGLISILEESRNE